MHDGPWATEVEAARGRARSELAAMSDVVERRVMDEVGCTCAPLRGGVVVTARV